MRRLWLLAVAASLVLPRWAVAADGQPNAAMQALYEKAKAEKEVSLWTPAAIEGSWVNDQFAKRFPGITVNLTADLQGATKIIAEARAGRHTVDNLDLRHRRHDRGAEARLARDGRLGGLRHRPEGHVLRRPGRGDA